MVYDAIVIGIGGMGSSASYYLARRGAAVLGLEQFNIGHDWGSSHGIHRIIRLAYAEGSAYVPMLRRAYHLWRQIQRVAGEQLLYVTGGVDIGPPDGNVVTGSLASCRKHRLRHELLDSRQLTRRFPGYRLPRELVAVYQPDGGFVLSERAIIAYASAAMNLGAELHGCEAVQGWKEERGRVTVRTTKATYQAKRLIITAGPWAEKVIPFLRKNNLAIPERQVLLWTQPVKPEHFQVETFPIFNMEAEEDGTMQRYYGCPVFGIPGFKIGKYHHLHESTDADAVDRQCHPRDEQVLRAAIQRFFPGANGPTLAMKTCLFTNSPDEHFLIGPHPGTRHVVVAAGFSGHGFKFASVVGEILSDLALEGGSSRFDLGMFALERSHAPADAAGSRRRATEAQLNKRPSF